MAKYFIVRSKSAGVFCAQIANKTPQGETLTLELKDSRRIWYWEGAASLSELAVRGTSKPASCKFPVAIPNQTVMEVCEIIEVSPKAKKTIDAVPVWTA